MFVSYENGVCVCSGSDVGARRVFSHLLKANIMLCTIHDLVRQWNGWEVGETGGGGQGKNVKQRGVH